MPKRTLAKRVPGCLWPAGLDDPLGHRLRGAHHRLRVDRLVGGDEDEALDPRGGRGLGRDPGRDRVVAHGLQRVCLHQRHVLVGGGVEDDARFEALHHLQHPVRLLAVGQHRLDAGEVALLDHLAVDLEEVVLGVVEHHQQPRADAGDLAAELGADRAAGAGDEDDAVAQVGADPVQLDHDRVAAEHVLDLDLAQLLVELDAAAQQLEHGRQGADADLALAAGGDDLGRAASPAPRGSRSPPRRARSRRGSSRSARSSPAPSAPASASPACAASSSTKPIAVAPRLGLSCSSRTTIWPPEPAPITSTSCLGRRWPCARAARRSAAPRGERRRSAAG